LPHIVWLISKKKKIFQLFFFLNFFSNIQWMSKKLDPVDGGVKWRTKQKRKKTLIGNIPKEKKTFFLFFLFFFLSVGSRSHHIWRSYPPSSYFSLDTLWAARETKKFFFYFLEGDVKVTHQAKRYKKHWNWYSHSVNPSVISFLSFLFLVCR
jgi:hypothetical protein